MAAPADSHLEDLANRLGHSFSSPELLLRALTHSSFATKQNKPPQADNERLEFLGDRVLGLMIAELLFKTYPKAREGELARMLNALVRKEACADVAREIDLGVFMRLGGGEQRAGGRRKMALLGNACEAIIAALYLDGGEDAARGFIERYWTGRLEAVAHAPRDPKTTLQEWCHGNGLPTPVYRVSEQDGPAHAPEFEVSVEIEGHGGMTGKGKSKQQAQQAAARAFIAANGIDKGNDG